MTYRILKENDVSDIMELQNMIIDRLPDKDLLRKNSSDMFRQVINSGACCIGVYDGENLVACGLSHLCQGSEEDLSMHLENHTCTNPVNMKSVMVHPDYRGKGLQRALMKMIEDDLRQRGFDAMICTVSPSNEHSVRNVLAMNYEFDHQEVKYESLLRYIYIKKLL